MWKCNGWTDFRQINLNDLIILCIFIRLISGILFIRMSVHVSSGLVIYDKDTVFSTCFNGHVCHSETVIHGQVCDTIADKLHRFV